MTQLPNSWTQLPRGLRDRVLARLLTVEGSNPANAIQRRPDPDTPAPTSFEQAWFLQRQKRHDNALGWTIAAPVEIIEGVKPKAVKAALAALQAERPELTAWMEQTASGWAQSYKKVQAIPLRETTLPITAMLTGARSFVRKRFDALNAQSFDPADDAPLWRAELVTGRGTGVVMLSFCSLVADGDTAYGLMARFKELYKEMQSGKLRTPAAPGLDYADYASWQRQQASDGAWDDHLAWWRTRLAGGPPQYWADGRPEAGPTRLFEQVIGTKTGAKIEAYAASKNASPYAVMLTAFMDTLSELDGGDDLWVTSPMANRQAKGSEAMAGPFARLVVLRHQHDQNADNLEAVQACLIDTAEASVVPHLLVAKQLAEAHPDAPSPFRYVCNYRQVAEETPSDANTNDVVFMAEPVQTEHIREEDLLFMVMQSGAQRAVHWYMRNDRFSPERAHDVMQRYLENLTSRIG